MQGVDGLAESIANRVKNLQQRQEAKAQRGIIQNGRVRLGSVSYDFTAVVDCNTDEGDLVWVLLTKNGLAVVVGA